MGGPLCELPILCVALATLFVNEGYQTGLLGIRYADDSELDQFHPHAKLIKKLIFPSEKRNRLPRLFMGQR